MLMFKYFKIEFGGTLIEKMGWNAFVFCFTFWH